MTIGLCSMSSFPAKINYVCSNHFTYTTPWSCWGLIKLIACSKRKKKVFSDATRDSSYKGFFLTCPSLQTRAYNKFPGSDLFICFPNLPVATDEKKPSPRMTSYFNISCPNVPGSLTLKQMLRKSLWNSRRPQYVSPSHFLCGTPELYFQHCSSTALPDLCLHKLMSGTYKGARGLLLPGMLSRSFWRLSSVKLSPLPSTEISE